VRRVILSFENTRHGDASVKPGVEGGQSDSFCDPHDPKKRASVAQDRSNSREGLAPLMVGKRDNQWVRGKKKSRRSQRKRGVSGSVIIENLIAGPNLQKRMRRRR